MPHRTVQHHWDMDNRQRQVAVTLGLAAVYVLAARFGLAFDPVGGFATLVWPPTGIALAAVLLLGNRVAPGIFLGAFVANYLTGAPVPVAIGIGVGNACEAVVGAALLRRIPSFSITLERVSSVVALIVWSAVVSTLISATVGVMTLYVGGIVQPVQIRDTWRAWWIGDMVGSLLIAPLILVWANPPRALREVQKLEMVALVASLVVVSALTFFGKPLGVPQLATPFHQADLLVAVLLWAALRFGQRGATTAVLGVSVVAIVATALQHGPFVVAGLSTRLMLLQTFMAIVATTSLVFGATICERRIANQDARHASMAAEMANNAKSQFLRVMSHELRTPLNAIQGFAELLETGVYGPLNEKQTDALKRIEQNEKDLLAIINEMLGFVDAEKMPVATESRDLMVADSFDAVERLFTKDVERKHLVVKRELANPGLVVQADPKGLQQILASLVSNAAKYSADGGTITLGADADGDKVRLWVRDTGIGIKKEEIDRVFEPFFQSDSGTTRQYSGVGLGLTIAHDLAQRMSGEITIESEVGKGTTASVSLPVGAAKAGADVERSDIREVA
jgi:signal transduction histidine kinase